MNSTSVSNEHYVSGVKSEDSREDNPSTTPKRRRGAFRNKLPNKQGPVKIRGSKCNCSVFGCSNTYANTKGREKYVHFYSFPSRPWQSEMKAGWIHFCNRKTTDGKPWAPSKNGKLCSEHFIDGVKSEDPRKPNYLPTIPPPPSSKTIRKVPHSLPSGVRKKKERKVVREPSPPPVVSDSLGEGLNFEAEEDENCLEEVELASHNLDTTSEEEEGEKCDKELAKSDNDLNKSDEDQDFSIEELENPSNKGRYLIRVVKRFVRTNQEASSQTDRQLQSGTLQEFSTRFDGPHVATLVVHGKNA